MKDPIESPDRWQRLWDVFHAAVERDAQERDAFLDDACGGNPELRRQVDHLLRAHASDGILDRSVMPVDPLPRTLATGDRLASRFRIVRLVGAGGMGTVYEAVDEELGTTVALKTLHPELARNTEALERFRREVVLARRVTHSNACRLFDLFHHQDGAEPVAFVTMELLRGETLAERLRRTGPLTEDAAYPIVEQVAAALSAAHRVGVVHRDLKSANVVLVPAGEGEPADRAVVTDFGLAGLSAAIREEGGADITRTGQLLGTPAYMAPEQLEGGEVTAAADIYALGLVMYEIVTGVVPFAQESPLTIAIKRLREPPPQPRVVRPNLRAEWNATIVRCLERDPVDRFATPEAVVAALQPGSTARVFIPRRLRRRAAAVAVAAIALVAAAATAMWWTPSNAAGPTLAFNERDWVLVADFENRTGEALLDDTIRFALERELNTSQFVNVVPRERVADALALMKRSADTRIAGDIAREVALRDGGIRALVRGRIEKLGGTYVTAAELIDPATGVVVANFATDARGQDAILGSVRELSNQLRTAVGEELSRVQHTSEKLAHVTTPSLRALQLFSQADSLIIQGRSAAAEQLLKNAIDEDSSFASAYMHLAHAIRNQRRSPGEFLPYAERAMELVDTAGDGERQFIQGSYYGIKGDFRRALASYEALLQLHPDHYWGNNNAGMILARDMRRAEDAMPYFARVSALRPNDLVVNHNMAYRIAVWGKNLDAARKPIDRAKALLTPESRQVHPLLASWIEVFTAHELRLRGDVRASLEELQRVERALPTQSGPHDPEGRGASAFPYELMLAYQSLGRFRDAERVFAVSPLSFVGLVNAFLRGDPRLRERWSAVSARSLPQIPLSAVIFARVQLGAATQAITSRFARVRPGNAAETLTSQSFASAVGAAGAFALIARAELAVLQGKPREAIALYEQGLPAERQLGSAVYFLGCEGLARVWLAQNDANRAIALLEDAVQQRDRTIRGSSGAFWLRVVWQLAKVYRQVGRNDDAAKLEAELRQLLAVADADHPILVEMQRGRAAASLP